MNTVLAAALLSLAAMTLVLLPRHLRSATWPTRVPATALLLWQAAFVTGLLAILGAGIFLGLRPLRSDVPHAVVEALEGSAGLEVQDAAGRLTVAVLLLTLLVGSTVIVNLLLELRHRRNLRDRQRMLVDLVSTNRPGLPGVDVVDHPLPTAYSIPGRSWRIVVTRGLLEQLEPAQIQAVLAHERAHYRQRHHWVTLLFAVAVRCRVLQARAAFEQVRGLLEMCADDAVRRDHADETLASALLHLTRTTGAPPPVAFAAADRLVVDRVQRLIRPTPRSRWLPPLGLLSAAGLVAAPILAIVVPCLSS